MSADPVPLERKRSVKVATSTTPTTNGLLVTVRWLEGDGGGLGDVSSHPRLSPVPPFPFNPQTGYLLKLSGSLKPNGMGPAMWKRRYFMLRGCTFTYYSDHQTMQEPKGELLVFAETKLSSSELSGQKHCFTLMTPFPALHLACETADDLQVWLAAFRQSTALAHRGLRSYVTKAVPQSDGPSKRKFFILHQDAVTIHMSAESISVVQVRAQTGRAGALPSHLFDAPVTVPRAPCPVPRAPCPMPRAPCPTSPRSLPQGLIHLNDNTFMEYYDQSLKITLVDTAQKLSLTLQFDPPETCGPADGLYGAWKDALTANLRLYTALVQNAEAAIDTVRGIPNQIKEGFLRMRPPKGGDAWPEHRFFINEHAMVVVDREQQDPHHARVIGEYLISPTCRYACTRLDVPSSPLSRPLSHVSRPPAGKLAPAWRHAMRLPSRHANPNPRRTTSLRSPLSVFETNLGRNTFELVTAKKVLHVQTPTADELIEWMQVGAIQGPARALPRPYLASSLGPSPGPL